MSNPFARMGDLFLKTESKSPCVRSCKGRGPECHGSCPAYAEYKRGHEKEAAAERERKAIAQLTL